MASSRKPRRASGAATPPAAARAVEEFLDAYFAAQPGRGRRISVGLSGGVDSVVLLHALRELAARRRIVLRAVHVHHGISPNADEWSRFCARLCRAWSIPLTRRRVSVGSTRGRGIEAAARDARYRVYAAIRADALALAHHRDDQAETVLLNLLRGAGLRGAAGMPPIGVLGSKALIRPLLNVARADVLDYARLHGLAWIEDESNVDETLARGFLRERVAPLLDQRFRGWQSNLARAARRFGGAHADERALLREFLAARGLRAPSEAKLAEMLRQLASRRRDARVAIEHDGAVLRLHRGAVKVTASQPAAQFGGAAWNGERRMSLADLGGELVFERRRGAGISLARLEGRPVTLRGRSGGEKLRLAETRPRRSLKKLFQEAGVPHWERARLPLLYCGEDLVWVPGVGVDAAYRAARGQAGLVPRWRSL
jgi:tRNA(Ile)-lysidine synthase